MDFLLCMKPLHHLFSQKLVELQYFFNTLYLYEYYTFVRWKKWMVIFTNFFIRKHGQFKIYGRYSYYLYSILYFLPF